MLPLADDKDIARELGTRHRAALEASLNSDCVAVVTSEETGVISVAVEGNLKRGITDSELREVLGQYLLPTDTEKRSKKKKRDKDNPENAEALIGEEGSGNNEQ